MGGKRANDWCLGSSSSEWQGRAVDYEECMSSFGPLLWLSSAPFSPSLSSLCLPLPLCFCLSPITLLPWSGLSCFILSLSGSSCLACRLHCLSGYPLSPHSLSDHWVRRFTLLSHHALLSLRSTPCLIEPNNAHTPSSLSLLIIFLVLNDGWMEEISSEKVKKKGHVTIIMIMAAMSRQLS